MSVNDLIRAGLVLLGLLAWTEPARALVCEDRQHDGARYSVCTVDMAQDDLRLFLNDETGAPYGQFGAVDAALATQGLRLAFATNGGMYHDDLSPVGHLIEDGQERMRVIPNAGPGNFGLLPNGILCIGEGRADVIETRAYLERRPACRYATQSGPMLVIDGALHRRFKAASPSRLIRNGVGTTDDGARAIFAIANDPVNFHQFARFFRDALGLKQALFLDGRVSRLYAPELGRADLGWPMGPIAGVVVPAE